MKKTVLLKTITLLIAACFALSNAHEYTVYDMNGKNCGSINGVLDKYSLAKFAKENHGSVLVKKESLKNLNQHKLTTKQVDKSFNISRNFLNKETWLEVEKNEIVKVCVDRPVVAWETSMN